MACFITELNSKQSGESKLKRIILIGSISEALLVIGISLVFYGVGMALTHQMVAHCTFKVDGFCVSSIGDVNPYFSIGVVSLILSAIGFLYVLNYARKAPTNLIGARGQIN